jgi:hypothetical protein
MFRTSDNLTKIQRGIEMRTLSWCVAERPIGSQNDATHRTCCVLVTEQDRCFRRSILVYSALWLHPSDKILLKAFERTVLTKD